MSNRPSFEVLCNPLSSLPSIWETMVYHIFFIIWGWSTEFLYSCQDGEGIISTRFNAEQGSQQDSTPVVTSPGGKRKECFLYKRGSTPVQGGEGHQVTSLSSLQRLVGRQKDVTSLVEFTQIKAGTVKKVLCPLSSPSTRRIGFFWWGTITFVCIHWCFWAAGYSSAQVQPYRRLRFLANLLSFLYLSESSDSGFMFLCQRFQLYLSGEIEWNGPTPSSFTISVR